MKKQEQFISVNSELLNAVQHWHPQLALFKGTVHPKTEILPTAALLSDHNRQFCLQGMFFNSRDTIQKKAPKATTDRSQHHKHAEHRFTRSYGGMQKQHCWGAAGGQTLAHALHGTNVSAPGSTSKTHQQQETGASWVTHTAEACASRRGRCV